MGLVFGVGVWHRDEGTLWDTCNPCLHPMSECLMQVLARARPVAAGDARGPASQASDLREPWAPV